MQHIPLKTKSIEPILKGYPWVLASDIHLKIPPAGNPGDLVYLRDGSKPIAIAYYNPLTKIACRVLTQDCNTAIDTHFFLNAFSTALARRQRYFTTPFYRLVHAEADGLPGLIIDRFGDTLVCQTNTAGMEKLKPLWFPALQDLLKPTRVIFRDDAPSRTKEGLTLEVTAPIGSLDEQIIVEENGMLYIADPNKGQKTGWFYDQRTNRKWVSERTRHKTVLDLYTYSGGFGISALGQQARHVTFVDGSENALSLAQSAAHKNNVESRATFIHEDVFALLPRLHEANQQFEVVIADPPAFVKQAYHKGSGLNGYQKLAKLASEVVAPGGLLFIASCSHHASNADFRQAVEKGIANSGRTAALIRKAGADKDHPIHPLLPQSQYLKSLAFRFD